MSCALLRVSLLADGWPVENGPHMAKRAKFLGTDGKFFWRQMIGGFKPVEEYFCYIYDIIPKKDGKNMCETISQSLFISRFSFCRSKLLSPSSLHVEAVLQARLQILELVTFKLQNLGFIVDTSNIAKPT